MHLPFQSFVINHKRPSPVLHSLQRTPPHQRLELFPSSSLMNDSRNICSSKIALAIKRKTFRFSMRTAIKIIEHAHRVASRVFSPIAGRVDVQERKTLSPFMLRRPQHLNQNIFSSGTPREREKESRKLRKNQILEHFPSLFYLLCFASTAFFSFRERNKALKGVYCFPK